MPRLSLYKSHKGNDYNFLDQRVYEMFTIGGTDVNIHKYIGTDDGESVKDHTQIQDLLFLENRDRRYDQDVYTIRGIYNVQDIDFDLSQFGLFLSNDTLFMTIHINSSVKALGRKIMNGDVFELPHLKDEYAANDFATSLKRYYVVEDVNRASEGFSPTWYPHLYRVKLKQLVDSQEFADVLERPENNDNYIGNYDSGLTYQSGDIVKYQGVLYEATTETSNNAPPDAAYWQEYQDTTLRDLLSTYEKEMQINTAVLAEAESNVSKSGYNVKHYYTLDVDEHTGRARVSTVEDSDAGFPDRLGYDGYLIFDGSPPNGVAFGVGVGFPIENEPGDYFLRTDYLPNRLFKFDGRRWLKMYDNVRTDLNNIEKQNLKGTFINNTNSTTIGGDTVEERQALSQALKPKADN